MYIRSFTKIIILFAGMTSLTALANIVQAQETLSAQISLPDSGILSDTNNFNSYSQPNISIDSGSSSQQFFRQGRGNFHFFPEDTSENNFLDNILKNDYKTIEVEGLELDSFQDKLPDN